MSGRRSPSKGWADVEADLGIDQRLLGGCNAISGELGIKGRAPLDESKGNGPDLEVPCRAADKADPTAIKHQIRSRRWQRIDAAV